MNISSNFQVGKIIAKRELDRGCIFCGTRISTVRRGEKNKFNNALIGRRARTSTTAASCTHIRIEKFNVILVIVCRDVFPRVTSSLLEGSSILNYGIYPECILLRSLELAFHIFPMGLYTLVKNVTEKL